MGNVPTYVSICIHMYIYIQYNTHRCVYIYIFLYIHNTVQDTYTYMHMCIYIYTCDGMIPLPFGSSQPVVAHKKPTNLFRNVAPAAEAWRPAAVGSGRGQCFVSGDDARSA